MLKKSTSTWGRWRWETNSSQPQIFFQLPGLSRNVVQYKVLNIASIFCSKSWYCSSGKNQAEGRLHEEAAWHHQQHEGHSGWLAGRGWRRVQATERDALSGCKLHRPLPLLNVSPEGEASAGWDCCNAAGFVRAQHKICLVVLQIFCLHFLFFSCPVTWLFAHPNAGNLKRSTPLRWQSLFTSQTTPTPRSRC